MTRKVGRGKGGGGVCGGEGRRGAAGGEGRWGGKGKGGVGLKLVFCCPNQSLVNDSHFQPPGETGEGALSILVRA